MSAAAPRSEEFCGLSVCTVPSPAGVVFKADGRLSYQPRQEAFNALLFLVGQQQEQEKAAVLEKAVVDLGIV